MIYKIYVLVIYFVKLLNDVFGNSLELLYDFVEALERRCVFARDMGLVLDVQRLEDEFLLFRTVFLMNNEIVFVVARTTLQHVLV